VGLVDNLLVYSENTYTNPQEIWMAKNDKLHAEEYSFSGRLNVGLFTSFEACPKKIVADAQQSHRWPLSLLKKFDLGHAIHDVYQNRCMNTPGLKMVKPWNIPDAVVPFSYKPAQTVKQLLDEKWGEIPCTYRNEEGEVILLGYADDVYLEGRRPTVLDIKTINIEEKLFKNHFDDSAKDYLPKYWTQVMIYQILMNLDEYWAPLKVSDKVSLLFVATKMVGEPDSERQLFNYVKDEHITKFLLQMKESSRQLRDNTLDCKFRYCNLHSNA
jgi:hypothetical protein